MAPAYQDGVHFFKLVETGIESKLLHRCFLEDVFNTVGIIQVDVHVVKPSLCPECRKWTKRDRRQTPCTVWRRVQLD